jgi:hypothetical protein
MDIIIESSLNRGIDTTLLSKKLSSSGVAAAAADADADAAAATDVVVVVIGTVGVITIPSLGGSINNNIPVHSAVLVLFLPILLPFLPILFSTEQGNNNVEVY